MAEQQRLKLTTEVRHSVASDIIKRANNLIAIVELDLGWLEEGRASVPQYAAVRDYFQEVENG